MFGKSLMGRSMNVEKRFFLLHAGKGSCNTGNFGDIIRKYT